MQVGIRNMSAEEVDGAAGAQDDDLLRLEHARGPATGSTRVVDALVDTVYITIDLDGLDPAMMPAVGTPEPGGLSWRELTALLRRTFERRKVVACDVVELCPIPGMAAPNFIAAQAGLQAADVQVRPGSPEVFAVPESFDPSA